MPDFSVSSRKGLEIAVPYHCSSRPIATSTLTPHIYTGVLPAIEAKYRELNSIGAFQIGGFLTYGTIDQLDPNATMPRAHGSFRGYFDANGKCAARSRTGASPPRSG